MSSNEIYRYKFTKSISELIHTFSKLHQHADREAYKEEWKRFVEEHKDIIDIEARRLLNLGYNGNIEDKMYKSGRYYFKHKNSDKTIPKKRNTYIKLTKTILEAIDNFIKKNHNKPATAYLEFVEEKSDIITTEINSLSTKYNCSSKMIESKIKKAFKNRSFNLNKKNI